MTMLETKVEAIKVEKEKEAQAFFNLLNTYSTFNYPMYPMWFSPFQPLPQQLQPQHWTRLSYNTKPFLTIH